MNYHDHAAYLYGNAHQHFDPSAFVQEHPPSFYSFPHDQGFPSGGGNHATEVAQYSSFTPLDPYALPSDLYFPHEEYPATFHPHSFPTFHPSSLHHHLYSDHTQNQIEYSNVAQLPSTLSHVPLQFRVQGRNTVPNPHSPLQPFPPQVLFHSRANSSSSAHLDSESHHFTASDPYAGHVSTSPFSHAPVSRSAAPTRLSDEDHKRLMGDLGKHSRTAEFALLKEDGHGTTAPGGPVESRMVWKKCGAQFAEE